MSKPLPHFDFDLRQARTELTAFDALLGEGETKELEEASDILPFFKSHPHLAALIGCCSDPGIGSPDLMKPEYGVVGTHVCDLVVGQEAASAFSAVEFEDAKATSVFKKQRGGRVPDWSPRLGRGFDQIVDWFCALDSIRHSELFRTVFGSSLATFSGLLVIGRRGHLSDAARARLRWRSQKVQVAGCPVAIITYDELRDRLATRTRLAT
jgi:hypothetical protein